MSPERFAELEKKWKLIEIDAKAWIDPLSDDQAREEFKKIEPGLLMTLLPPKGRELTPAEVRRMLLAAQVSRLWGERRKK